MVVCSPPLIPLPLVHTQHSKPSLPEPPLHQVGEISTQLRPKEEQAKGDSPVSRPGEGQRGEPPFLQLPTHLGLTALLTAELCPLPAPPHPRPTSRPQRSCSQAGLGPRGTPTCSSSQPSTELRAAGASAPRLVATVSRKESYDSCVVCELTEA